MKPRKVIENTIWFGIIPQVSTLINILILPLITPFLTAFDYGVNGIINSYMSLFLTISILGLNVHLTNSFYTLRKRFNLLWGRILAIILISSLIFAIIYALILTYNLTEVKGSIKVLTIIGSCLPILFQANKLLANHYYPLIYNPKPYVLRNLFTSLLGVIITFICIYILRLGFLGWVTSSAIVSITNFVLFIKPLWIDKKIFPIFSIKQKRLKNWILISLPIIPHSLGFIILSSSDRIIMQIIGVSFHDIGLYSNGYQIGSYINIITAAMITAVLPKIQEMFRSNQFKQLKSLYLFIQITTITGIFLFSIWIPQIYEILIRNKELKEASFIAFIICFSNIVFPFYAFISTTAFIEERTYKLLWLILLPGIVNIILNFVFIPIYGYKSAIFTTLVSYWLQLLIPLFEPYFKNKVRLIFGTIKFPILLLFLLIFILLLSIFIVKISIIAKTILTIILIMLYLMYFKRQKDFN